MRALAWLFRAFILFTLFAFALNNQQTAIVHWFFGAEWHTPMVVVVLVAFTVGCVVGVVSMVPSWWRHRRVAKRHAPPVAPPDKKAPATVAPSDFHLEHPPREGL